MNTRLMQIVYKESIAAGAEPQLAWKIAFRLQRQALRDSMTQAL